MDIYIYIYISSLELLKAVFEITIVTLVKTELLLKI